MLYKAIGDEDLQKLSLAPGVGKKLASRLVLELKGKLPSSAGGSSAPGVSGGVQAEVLEALIGLGFSAAEAQAALKKIPQDHPLTLEEQVTFALRSFARD